MAALRCNLWGRLIASKPTIRTTHQAATPRLTSVTATAGTRALCFLIIVGMFGDNRLTRSHQPLVLNVSIHYDGGSTSRPAAASGADTQQTREAAAARASASAPPPSDELRSFYGLSPKGERLWLRHCDSVLFGTPVPTHINHGKFGNSDSTFYVRRCPISPTAQTSSRSATATHSSAERFWLSPIAVPGGSIAPLGDDGSRFVVVPTPGDCALGLNVFEKVKSISDNISAFSLQSLTNGKARGMLLTLADGCSCPGRPSGSCNFTAAGDTCREAVVAPTASSPAAQQQQLWFEAPPNAQHAPPLPPAPPLPVPEPYRKPVALDAHASRSHDGSELSVRVVNPLDEAVIATVVVRGLQQGHGFSKVHGVLLTSESRLDDNSPTRPTHVSPRSINVTLLPTSMVGDGDGSASVSTAPVNFPANSFITMQFS